MTRVVVIILHAQPAPDAGPLTCALATMRLANAETQAAAFAAVGADAVRVIPIQPTAGETLGATLRSLVAGERATGVVVLGSGAVPLATQADRREFVEIAGARERLALANNRYSADIVAIADARRLTDLPDLVADNGLPRWLAEDGGYAVFDRRRRTRLQIDLDSPLDGVLLVRAGGERAGKRASRDLAGGPPLDFETGRVRAALDRLKGIARDSAMELVVHGRTSAGSLAWLERSTASRTRALVEERGLRTALAGQRPARSVLGLLLDRDGPEAFGTLLAELGDGALVDSRVLLAHRLGADEASWPVPEDRFASDLLLHESIADPWLAALTRSAATAPLPILLGGHTLVGPGLWLALRESGRRWT